ncbi:MAG: PilZ domain-containing protein [Myxococcota bacterium]|nr:PilZ domain-containing protein [Myxococcota bacterium]
MPALSLWGRKEYSHPLPVLELPPIPAHSAINRRLLPRFLGEFQIHDHDHNDDYTGINVSFGGLRCYTQNPVWPGNIINISFNLPGLDKSIAAKAKVEEIIGTGEKLGMRLRFVDIKENERKRIAIWMTKLTTGKERAP